MMAENELGENAGSIMKKIKFVQDICVTPCLKALEAWNSKT